MDPQFIAELNERLFVHFSQGQWRAPLGQRLLPVQPVGAARLGRIVCGDGTDAQRAIDGVLAGGTPDHALMTQQWQTVADGAARLRQIEGFRDPIRQRTAPIFPLEGTQGPLVILSAADAPLSDLVPLLVAQAPRGVVWKPAPRSAASAHYVMQALTPAAAGRLALVQGDHLTGAELARHGPVIWASDAPLPADLAGSAWRVRP